MTESLGRFASPAYFGCSRLAIGREFRNSDSEMLRSAAA